MTFLGALVPAFMFLEDNPKIKIFAILIFLGFQIGAVAVTNVGRPEIRFFDKPSRKYRIKRPNHFFTRLFRKTWLNRADLGHVTQVKMTTFTAKRWKTRIIGSGENKYRHQELCMFENYHLSLENIGGECIHIYDMYDQDHVLDCGEKIAKYLGVKLVLDME